MKSSQVQARVPDVNLEPLFFLSDFPFLSTPQHIIVEAGPSLYINVVCLVYPIRFVRARGDKE